MITELYFYDSHGSVIASATSSYFPKSSKDKDICYEEQLIPADQHLIGFYGIKEEMSIRNLGMILFKAF